MATRYQQFDGYNKLSPATTIDDKTKPTVGVMTDGTVDFTGDDNLFTKYQSLIQRALNDTSVWRMNQDAFYKQRMRIKKKKVFPYDGCSNLRMPTDETQIRKKKAKHANRIFGIRPIVQAVPPPGGDPKKAQRIEKFLDHLLIDVMKFYPKALVWIDKMLGGGFSLAKTYWRTETTKRMETFGLADMSVQDAAMMFSHGTDPEKIKQVIIQRLDIDMNDLVADDNEKEVERAIVELYQGKEEVTIDVYNLIYNAPDVATPDTERIIVPVESGLDPDTCEWICHDLIIPYRDFLARTERGYKNIDKVNGLLTKAVDPNFPLEETKRFREGIVRFQTTGGVRLWEVEGWEKLTAQDSAPRKCIMTFAPDFAVTLRRISADHLDGETSFARINNEIVDDRWYSPRGIPEMISDIVKEIDVQKNQRIDSQTTRNAPLFMYRVGIVNPNIKLRPNKGIPVPAGVPFEQAFQMVNNTNLNAEFSYKDEYQQLQAATEELLGEINFTLQAQINKRQPRTGTEVEAQVQGAMPSTNLEGDIVIEGVNTLIQKVFALWCKYGDDEYEFQYFGPSQNGQVETIKIQKHELQGHIIAIRGNDANTNPQVRLQKAQQLMQLTADPISLQMGITTPQNYYAAKREMYLQMGVNPDMYCSQPQPPKPPQPPVSKIQLGAEDLTPVELMQLKKDMGINPDIKGNLEMGIRDHQRHIMELSQGSNEIVAQQQAAQQKQQEIALAAQQQGHQQGLDNIQAMQSSQDAEDVPAKAEIDTARDRPTTRKV